MEWTIFGDAIDDVYPVCDCLSASAGGYYFLLGSRAAQAALNAYDAGLLPMKAGERPRNAFMAKRYIGTDRRIPDFVDMSLCVVPGAPSGVGERRAVAAA